MTTTPCTRPRLITAVVAAALAAVAVMAGTGSSAAGTAGPDDSLALPRAVAYAGLTWTIDSAASNPAMGSPAAVRLAST